LKQLVCELQDVICGKNKNHPEGKAFEASQHGRAKNVGENSEAN
jgi:hypothetical protein